MGITIAIALGALFASLAPLAAMALMYRQKGDVDFAGLQNARITDLVRQLDDCQHERHRLEQDNLRLMRELFTAKNGPN